jgi:hypothetical protein
MTELGDLTVHLYRTYVSFCPFVRITVFHFLLKFFLYIYFVFLQSHTFIITFVQYSLIHLHLPRPLSVFFIAFAQREKPLWGAEPGFELGPAVQQASTLPTELCCTLFLLKLQLFFLQEAAVHIPLSQDLYETVRDMVSSAAGVMSRPLVPPPQQPSAAVLRNPLGPQPGFQPPAGLSGPQNRHSLPPSLFPGKEAAAGCLVNKVR